jgi:uncharacterized membrane protein YecN with MAPEG domain
MILPITLTITAAATLLNIWLGMRVSQLRRAYRISIGDGGNEALIARMRAQANYIENTPFFLILLGLTEVAVGPHLWLWIVAALYILARIAHGLGMSRPRPDKLRLRMIGMIATGLILVGLAIHALVLAYSHLPAPGPVNYAAAGRA